MRPLSRKARGGRCAWHALAVLAAAPIALAAPLVRLEADVLSISTGGQRYRIALGPPQLLRTSGNWSAGAWRRSGRNDSDVAAVILRGSPARSPSSWTISHAGILTSSGVWELRPGENGWVLAPVLSAKQGRRLSAWSGMRFEHCWPGDDEGLREVKVGFACDQGYIDSTGGSGESAMRAIEEMVSMANLVYENQISVHVSIGEVLVPSQWPKELSGAARPCGQAIDSRLNQFQVFARANLAGHHMAAFVQLTDCYRPAFGLFGSTEIGVACVGTLCNPVHSYAVVSWNQHTWLTFSHELGHIFGARHAFEDGKGTTGGIMDYGDGRWQGAYQFHPYNKRELCGFIARSMTKPRLYELADCWRPYAPEASGWPGHWSDGAWSNCSASCAFSAADPAEQERRPLCLDYRSGILPDGKCPADERPAVATRPCQPAARPCSGRTRWIYGPWGECQSLLNLTCGAGRQFRKALCRGDDGEARNDCWHPAPEADVRGCSLKACARKAVWVQSPSWRKGPHCSDETAYQVRELQCVDTVTLQPAKVQQCPLAKPPPDFRQVSAPSCPSTGDPCCLDQACHEYKVDGVCLRRGRRPDAATCVRSPSGERRLLAALGGELRWAAGCELARPGPRAALRERFPGLPPGWASLDALVAGPAGGGELLLLRGAELLRFSLEANAAFRGYPKATAKEFDGIAEACPKCASRVSAGLWDEDTETLRLWCGYGEVYCLSRQPWRAITKPGDWTLRPSQDMGVTSVRGALKERAPGVTVLLANGSRCNVRDGLAACSPEPLPYFGAAGSAACPRLAFCAVCDADQCQTCEQGFELSWGRCVPFTARLWADFPARGHGVSAEAALGRHGALDEGELGTWKHVPGPFVGSSAVSARPALRMAAVRDGRGDVVRMRRWSLTAWVRGHSGASGTLLSAKQDDDSLLLMSWGDCGPSMEYRQENETVWRLSCDEHLAGGLVGEAWVRVGFDFQDGSAVLRIQDKELRREADLRHMSLDVWSVGGADVEIGMLQILDREKWPRIHVGALQSTWPLLAVALVICLVGALLTACAWRLRPPEGMSFGPQGCLACAAEAYVNLASTLLALLGVAAAAGVFLLLALGPAGGRIGLRDLALGVATGELAAALLPLGVGLVLFAAGIAGIRMARTRDCCWILAYLVWMSFCLRLQYTVLVYLDAIDPRFQRPELASLAETDLLQEVDSDFQSNGQQPLLREIQDTFARLMSRANYDCRLLDERRASCSAEAGGREIIRCAQPYAAAKAFEELVNRRCSPAGDVKLCASCMESFGRLAGAPGWDPRRPESRVFCKCASNLLTYARGWLLGLGHVCRGLGVAEVALLASVLYLACLVPNRRELLLRQVSRVQQVPQQLRRHSRDFVQRVRSQPGAVTATSACAWACASLQLVAGIFILHSAVFVVGRSAVLPSGLETGALMLGVFLVILSSCVCFNKAFFNAFYACGNILLMCLVSASALLLMAIFVADMRDPGEMHFPHKLREVHLPSELPLPNASLELQLPEELKLPKELQLPKELRVPKELHLSNATLRLQIPNATDIPVVKSIGAFMSWVLQHDSARQVFVQAFDRGAYDCDVQEDGGSCTATAGILCKASAAEDFEWAVNRLCRPSAACGRCLRALRADPLEARNGVWCRCVGAFEGLLRRAWPLALALVAWQGLATAAAVGHARAAEEELSDSSEDEPLIIDVPCRKSRAQLVEASGCSNSP